MVPFKEILGDTSFDPSSYEPLEPRRGEPRRGEPHVWPGAQWPPVAGKLSATERHIAL